MAECSNQVARIELDLGRHDLGGRLYDIGPSRLPHADYVRRAPLVLEAVPANADAFRAFLKLVDQPVPERPIEILFSYLLPLEFLGDFLLLLFAFFPVFDGAIEPAARLVDCWRQLRSELVQGSMNCVDRNIREMRRDLLDQFGVTLARQSAFNQFNGLLNYFFCARHFGFLLCLQRSR